MLTCFHRHWLGRTPVHTIAMNAGAEGAVVVGELLKTDSPQMGYNAATGEYCDMIAAGIIDPTKVGGGITWTIADGSASCALSLKANGTQLFPPQSVIPRHSRYLFVPANCSHILQELSNTLRSYEYRKTNRPKIAHPSH